MDKTNPPVPGRIGDLMQSRRYSLNALAQESGIPYATLHRKLTKGSAALTLTMREVLALAKVLSVTPAAIVGAVAAETASEAAA